MHNKAVLPLLGYRSAFTPLIMAVAALLLLVPTGAFASVTHTTGSVNGVQCDIWSWTDSAGQERTVALKMEGNGNPGHGGYAVQMTYFYENIELAFLKAMNPWHRGPSPWIKVTVNAASTSDGGFWYFVSHERY